MICANAFVWWDLKEKKHFKGIFFLSDLENILYSEKKETLSHSDGQKAHKRNSCFLKDLDKLAVFLYNINFHFCIE